MPQPLVYSPPPTIYSPEPVIYPAQSVDCSSEVQPIVVQPKPVYPDEVRAPLLDFGWDIENVKPKSKSRPLPPLPLFHLQTLPRVEAAPTKGGRRIPQPPMGTGYVEEGQVPCGFYGKPIFTPPPSRPLPRPPTFDGGAPQMVYLDDTIEQFAQERRGRQSRASRSRTCEAGPTAYPGAAY